jgi:hypothetical protein
MWAGSGAPLTLLMLISRQRSGLWRWFAGSVGLRQLIYAGEEDDGPASAPSLNGVATGQPQPS